LRGSTTRLINRDEERRLLDQLVAAVRGGESRALVLHGEAGVGKTALLEYVSERATDAGCRVVSAAGVQAEMELAFASLHELCTPLLERLNAIPKPQQDALSTPSSTKNARCVEPWSSASITSTVTSLPSEIAMK
jgi:GTPase SAR1 family protein